MLLSTHSRRALTLCVFMLGAAEVLVCQTTAPPAAGARVRVTMRDFAPRRLTGRLVAFDRNYITIRGDSANPEVVIPADLLLRFEVNRGRNPAVLIGVPTLLGVAGALVAPLIMTERRECRFTPEGPGCSKQTPDEAIGAAVGVIAGLFLGPLVTHDRWREIPVRHLLAQWNRQSGTIRFGVAARF